MKRIIKLIGKILLGLLVLPFVVVFIFWIKNMLFMGGVDADNTAYLKLNSKALDRKLLNIDSGSEIFDSAFYNHQIFLLGENHGYADVQLIDKHLFLNLNKKIGVKYYLAEMDSIRAKRLNEFLATDAKDTLLLKQVITDIKLRIPQQSRKELYQKWLEIYDYNKTLNDSLKISVIGIDTDFESQANTVSRDSMMLINFKKIIEAKNLEHEKFYGFFGYTHVLQSGFGEKNSYPFAAKIKRSNLAFSNKIQSIVCFTLESEMNMPKNNQTPSPPDERTSLFNLDGPLVVAKGIKDLREVTARNTITIFDLNNENSPYRNNQKLASIKVNLFGEDLIPNNERQKTTDFFQYVILIRNSPALTKLASN